MIADTSFIIDIMENEPAAVKKAAEVEAGGLAISVGSPTIFELYVGLGLSEKLEEEKLKITSIITALPHLPLDSESASTAGLIYSEKTQGGKEIDPVDAMIAGIAKVHSETVITRNIKHFSGIEGVSVEAY